jgi:DNA-binding protein H-NS
MLRRLGSFRKGSPCSILRFLCLATIKMTREIHHLSEHELTDIIHQASKALEQKRQQARRETIAEMKTLAASIGVELIIKDEAGAPTTRQRAKVPIKFRDPANPNHAWSGRGARPKWLQAYLEQGRTIDEFRV